MNHRDRSSDDLASSLIRSIYSPEVSDLSKDIAEIALDSVLEEGLIREIPVVKTVVAIGKTATGIRDRIFIKKVLRFLKDLDTIPLEDKDELLKRVNEDKDYQKRLGETLVMILDRYDHLEKPGILAKLFVAHVRGDIDYNQFHRLALAVERAFIKDLHGLLDFFTRRKEGKAKSQWAPWDKLFSSGLSKIEVHIDTYRQRANRAAGSPYPVIEQKVSYTYNQDAETFARVILGDKFRFG